ncbi:AAA family ATPase [Alcaligenaceae bacterium]|nr:AAA family ATPase [Alcaligenaceae bacterium]
MHPRLTPGSVERTQLLERLKKARHKTCLLIHGPAGSGKTSLAIQWRAVALTLGHDIAWLAVQSRDGRQDLLHDLFDALDGVDPDLSREGRFLYNRGGTARHDAIVLALLRAQLLRTRPLTLVIDDWQYASTVNANMVLQTLLDCAPENLHVVIVSRSVSGIALARLRDQRQLEEIGPYDLRFSLEEVQAFIRPRQSDDSPVDARKLLEMTDGWAAGLRLVAWQPLAPTAPVQNAQDFTAYFNREVLSHLDDADIGTMCRLAAASGFNVSLAATLAGDQQGPLLVRRLHDNNLFVTSQRDAVNDAWYVFHPLFRELLLERFQRLRSEEQRRTHLIFTQWFGAKRHLQDAVYHAMAAGDHQQAVLWVERWARELFLNGELQQLARSVAKLPLNALYAHPSLLLWQGWTQLCYHQFSACHDTLALLAPRINGTSAAERDRHAHWLLLSFSLALQEENIDAALTMLPDMLNLRQGTDAVLIGGRRNLLGWLYTRVGQYEHARKILQGQAPLLEGGKPLLGSAFGHIITRSLYGLSWLFQGDVRQAEPALREALSQAEADLGRYNESTCNAAAYVSAVLYETNELEALHGLLEGRLDAIERVALPDALVTVALSFARLRCSEGNPLEAIEGLERLEEMASKRSLDRLLAFSLSERVRCLLQAGDYPAAQTVLQQLLFLAARHSHQTGAISRRVKGLAHYTVVLYRVAMNEDQAALDLLMTEDGDICLGRDVYGMRLLKALLLKRTGEHELALSAMHPVLLQSQACGLVRTLLDFGKPMLDLAQDCARL